MPMMHNVLSYMSREQVNFEETSQLQPQLYLPGNINNYTMATSDKLYKILPDKTKNISQGTGVDEIVVQCNGSATYIEKEK